MIQKLDHLIDGRVSFIHCKQAEKLSTSARAKMHETTELLIDIRDKMVKDEKTIKRLKKQYARLKAERHGYSC